MPAGRPAAVMARFSLAAISLFVALVALEFAGRWAGLWYPDHLFQYDPTVGYTLRAGGDINAYGVRGPAFPVAKPPGSTRIVMVGDSFTFGSGVRESESQPRQLERALNARAGARYEVINLGVPGYNIEQELLFFRAKGRALVPDVVIVAFTLSDAELGFLWLNDPEHRWRIQLKEFIKSHVGMYLWAKRIIYEVRVRRAHEAAKVWPMMAPLLDAAEGRPSPGWQRSRAALEAFGTECASRGAPCVLVIWPVLDRLGEYAYGHLHAFVRAQAESLGFQVIDLLPTFAGRDSAPLRVSPKDRHPNAEAHRLAAATIAADLRPMLDARVRADVRRTGADQVTRISFASRSTCPVAPTSAKRRCASRT
jgi:hypothetical protein